MHSDVYKWIWFKLDMMVDTILLHILYHLIDLDLDLDWRSQKCKKAKFLCQLSHTVFQSIWMEYYCLDLLVWWTSFSFHLVHLVFKGDDYDNIYIYAFVRKIYVGLCSDICELISFNLYMVVKTTNLCTLRSVKMTLTFSQCHSCRRNQKLWYP